MFSYMGRSSVLKCLISQFIIKYLTPMKYLVVHVHRAQLQIFVSVCDTCFRQKCFSRYSRRHLYTAHAIRVHVFIHPHAKVCSNIHKWVRILLGLYRPKNEQCHELSLSRSIPFHLSLCSVCFYFFSEGEIAQNEGTCNRWRSSTCQFNTH